MSLFYLPFLASSLLLLLLLLLTLFISLSFIIFFSFLPSFLPPPSHNLAFHFILLRSRHIPQVMNPLFLLYFHSCQALSTSPHLRVYPPFPPLPILTSSILCLYSSLLPTHCFLLFFLPVIRFFHPYIFLLPWNLPRVSPSLYSFTSLF